MRRALLALFATTALTLAAAEAQTSLPPPPQQPQLRNPPVLRTLNYTYTATTAAAVRRTGAVAAGGITWQCVQSYCTATGPWPTPGVASCQALAREVGRITAYGHPSARLNATQLAQCNAAPPPPPPPPPPPAPSPSPSPPPPPPPPSPSPSPPPPPPPPPPSGVAVATAELSVVGGPTAVRAPDIGPMAVATPETFVVGGVTITRAPDIPPVAVTTPEISIVGR